MSRQPAAPHVGAVIVTWNSAATIDRCLASIPESVPVVVVDNGSSDDTRARVEASRATLLTPDRNLGFGQGCNLGATHLEGRDILLLNPDAALDTGAIETLAHALAVSPGLGMVGPLIRDTEGSVELSWGDDPTLLAEWRRKQAHQRPQRAPDAPCMVDWVTGGCCLIRRAAWDRVGGFDPGYFLYFEDLDLCRRIRQVGYQVGFEPRASADHARGSSSKQIGTLVETYYRASQLRYYRTHRGIVQRLGLKAYLALKYGLKAGRSPHYRQILAMALGGRPDA